MRVLKILGLAVVLSAFGAPAVLAQATNPDMYESNTHFGAIAVANGPPLAYASATNYTTQREASSAARRACQKKGGQGCQTAINFEDVCGALASGTDGKWAVAQAPSKPEARTAVLAKCKDSGIDGCKVEIVACADEVS
ncbi:MAG TPA: DUF4189 domain-containing protein [Asticcacaulis sp.]|nr:DUF4189 domain-containing protein [Asticcacaulis sp.]